jgi:hypothetical protein
MLSPGCMTGLDAKDFLLKKPELDAQNCLQINVSAALTPGSCVIGQVHAVYRFSERPPR